MYRDDGAALRERGAALKAELAPLRAQGPPGAVARIVEIEEQRAQLRRFRWPYAPLVVAPLLVLATRGDLSASSVALDALPLAASVALLWREVSRQRRVLGERAAQLGRAPENAAPSALAESTKAGAAPEADDDAPSRSVAELVADNRALEWELDLYKHTGTQREILAQELPLEQRDIAQHGRPFLWLIGAVMTALVSLKVDDWSFPLPFVGGSLVLVLVGFALRASSFGAVLRTRLDLATRELRGAGAAANSALAGGQGSDGSCSEVLDKQAEVVARAPAPTSACSGGEPTVSWRSETARSSPSSPPACPSGRCSPKAEGR